MTETPTFRLSDPLPRGVTVLEASAGTGKTYAIAALAARFLAEGSARVDDLLVVTFSRAATAELNDRVRDRLRSSAAALEAALGGTPPTDPLDRLLAEGATPEVLAERVARLRTAFADFDKATIMTTHEFCQTMLTGLGVLAPQTPQSTLVEDLSWLADEVAADEYLKRYGSHPDGPPFPFGDDTQRNQDPGARSIARAAVNDPSPLVGHDFGGSAGERVRFAEAVRAEVARRKSDLRVFSFDDQLTQLADALDDPSTGEAARQRLASRFPVVLVDEFQDTDPVQWRILSRAFADDSTVVLIGDPKQAIYGFRGGDVQQYTAATRQAANRTTLTVNHRSDPHVVTAVGTLFAGIRLGEDIDVGAVSSARPRSLVARHAPWDYGLQIRTLAPDEPVSPWDAEHAIDADVVQVVSTLLAHDAPLAAPDGPLRPRDIAVLVRSNRRGQRVATALTRSGIHATFAGTSSVFTSDAASDWLTLLRALDHRRRPYLQRAWLTDFVGAGVRDIAQADEQRAEDWALLVHGWARVLGRTGIPGLLAAFDADTDFSARLLRRPDGERLVTDHHHMAEILHAHLSATSGRRPRELATWLAGEIDRARGDIERTRRLETDADAVQIMTVHRAKGLQWPVVLVPEASSPPWERPDEGQALAVPTASGRALDVAGRRAPGRTERFETSGVAAGDEELRTLYVALTRARSHAVTWWAKHWDIARAPLHRLLFAPHEPEHPARPAIGYAPEEHPDGLDPRSLPWLTVGGIAVEPVRPGATSTPVRPDATPEPLDARTWTRTVDATWRRTSFSGITAGTHDQLVHPDDDLVTDEADAAGPGAGTDLLLADPSPMADLPSGTTFGSLVHAIYETTDATGEDWRAALGDTAARALRRWPVPGVDAAALGEALAPSMDTPLGPLADEVRLRDIGPGDRLAEMDFEFALANPNAQVADLADLLERHLDPADPLAAYPGRLRHPDLAAQHLHGFLTGSIDAVLRVGPPGGQRYLVVDYKTNRLAPADEPLTLGHYTPRAMAAAMMDSHYPLQALLYSVTLHRFLRLRLPGYSPDRHLGGIAYLFVRGMAGADTPRVDGTPLGVFTWRPSSTLVVALSGLLSGGAA